MYTMYCATALGRDDRNCDYGEDRDARQDARSDVRSGVRLMRIVIDVDALAPEESNQRSR
jgi:hypothetical protein